MKTVIGTVKKQLRKIDDNALFSPQQIVDMGVIVDVNLKVSRWTVYRLIKRGDLKAIQLGSGSQPRFFVKGKVLKEFIRDRYQL